METPDGTLRDGAEAIAGFTVRPRGIAVKSRKRPSKKAKLRIVNVDL
jgi:hypothetical protein